MAIPRPEVIRLPAIGAADDDARSDCPPHARRTLANGERASSWRSAMIAIMPPPSGPWCSAPPETKIAVSLTMLAAMRRPPRGYAVAGRCRHH